MGFFFSNCVAVSQYLNFMHLNSTSSKKLQNHSHCVAPPASSVILLVKQKKWDFCHVSWAFLILHHVGQITQTFGHTICQMSSERRTLLLACHANADQSTKVHFGKNLSGNNLPKEPSSAATPYGSETELVTISSYLQFWCLIALIQTIIYQNGHMCMYH